MWSSKDTHEVFKEKGWNQNTDTQKLDPDWSINNPDFYNKLLKNKKVICFDLYGTLIYQQTSLRNKIKNYMKSKKNKIEADNWYVKKVLKLLKKWEKSDLDIKSINQELPESHIDKLPEADVEELQNYIKEDLEKVRRYRETLKVLKILKKKYKLALISNISKEYEEPLKKLIPEWLFDYKEFSYSLWKSKPDPEIFGSIFTQAKKDGLGVEDMVMVWDTRKHDMDWAEKVWMDRIFLDRKSKKMYYDEKRKIWVIHTLRDLTKLLG